MQKLIPALLLAVMAFVSCTKSDDDQAKATVWIVKSYLKPDPSGASPDVNKFKDETSLFTGFNFEFNDNDEWLIHPPSGNSITGKWVEDPSTGTIELALDPPSAPVQDVLGTWGVIEQTDTDLKLGDTTTAVTNVFQNRGLLHFQKQ